jgi:prepilin-type N-terminal cleavage/methylation domain-containing protein
MTGFPQKRDRGYRKKSVIPKRAGGIFRLPSPGRKACEAPGSTGCNGGMQGFTLIEIVIVLCLSAILIISVLPFLKVSLRSYMTVSQGKNIVQASRIGFNRFMGELKRIPENYNITRGLANYIEFRYLDQNGNMLSADVTYQLSGDQLLRDGVPIVDGVQSFQMQYFKWDGTEYVPDYDVGYIWRMRVKMSVGNSEGQFNLAGDIFPKAFAFPGGT